MAESPNRKRGLWNGFGCWFAGAAMGARERTRALLWRWPVPAPPADLPECIHMEPKGGGCRIRLQRERVRQRAMPVLLLAAGAIVLFPWYEPHFPVAARLVFLTGALAFFSALFAFLGTPPAEELIVGPDRVVYRSRRRQNRWREQRIKRDRIEAVAVVSGSVFPWQPSFLLIHGGYNRIRFGRRLPGPALAVLRRRVIDALGPDPDPDPMPATGTVEEGAGRPPATGCG